MRTLDAALVVVAVCALAIVAAIDLERVSTHTLTVYTTPALRDLLERDLIPHFRAQGGMPIEPVYTAAGEQYNRLRMSGDDPEADFFLHASPLYVQRGWEDGYFQPLRLEDASVDLNDTFLGPQAGAGVAWLAFAWTPIVEVFHPGIAAPPDLASAELRFGLPHPRLSNNGIYNVLLFETVDTKAGRWVLNRTVVQPVNARTSIGGVADGSFDVTLGYEAVAQFYQNQGAKVRYGYPNFAGENVTTAVLFTAGLVVGSHERESRQFIDFLFTNETQSRLTNFYFRPVVGPGSDVGAAVGPDVRVIDYDWTQWDRIEKAIPKYEVNSGAYQ